MESFVEIFSSMDTWQIIADFILAFGLAVSYFLKRGK